MTTVWVTTRCNGGWNPQTPVPKKSGRCVKCEYKQKNSFSTHIQLNTTQGPENHYSNWQTFWVFLERQTHLNMMPATCSHKVGTGACLPLCCISFSSNNTLEASGDRRHWSLKYWKWNSLSSLLDVRLRLLSSVGFLLSRFLLDNALLVYRGRPHSVTEKPSCSCRMCLGTVWLK